MKIVCRIILIMAAINIAVSLAMSGVCSAPIDQIFVGWRDLTICYPEESCTVGVDKGDANLGARFLFFISTLLVIGYALYKWLQRQ